MINQMKNLKMTIRCHLKDLNMTDVIMLSILNQCKKGATIEFLSQCCKSEGFIVTYSIRTTSIKKLKKYGYIRSLPRNGSQAKLMYMINPSGEELVDTH